MYRAPRDGRLQRRHSLESLVGEEPGYIAREYGRPRARYGVRPLLRDDQYYRERPRSGPVHVRYGSPNYRRQLPVVPVRDGPRTAPPAPGYYSHPPTGPRFMPPGVGMPSTGPPPGAIFVEGPPPPGLVPAGFWGPVPSRGGMVTPPVHRQPIPGQAQGAFRPVGPHNTPPPLITPPQTHHPSGSTPVLFVPANQLQNQPIQAQPQQQMNGQNPPFILITSPIRYESVSDSSGGGSYSKQSPASRAPKKKRSPHRKTTETLEGSILEASKANMEMKAINDLIGLKNN